MVQKVNFNNLTGDTLTVGNTVITGVGVTVGGSELAGGAKVYANASVMPTSGLTAGEFAYTGNAIFITNGSGWYRVAVVNQDPSITLDTSSISLGASGNTVNFSYTVSDPDGTIPTVTVSNSGIADTSVANINLYTANNTVTVDNFSATDWSGTITLTASDGISTAFDSLTVSVLYLSQYWDETVLSVGTSSTNSLNNHTFIDRSSNSLTVSGTSTTTQTAFHPYLDNWCSVHTGSSRAGGHWYTNFTSNTGTSGDFTVELWFFRTKTEELYCRPFSIGSGASNALETWGSNVFELKGTFTGLSGSGYKSSDTDLDKWHHIALARESGTLRLFIDGELAASGSNTTDLPLGHIIFGAVDDAGGYALNKSSKLADIRVVNGTAVYTSAFTPPTEALTEITNTIYMWNGNRVMDTSTNGATVVDASSSTRKLEIQSHNPYGQLSEYATGANKGSVYIETGGEVTITHNSAISAGTGDFCLQFWVYADSADNAGYKGLVAKYSGGAGGIWFQPNNGVLVVGFGTGILGTGTTNIMDNQWHHIAWTRSGSANKVFIDGVQELSFTASDDLNNTVDMLIGDIGSLSRNFQGYVSDLKYDVGNAVYTSAFTPPTSPVGNTNADLYLPMDNAGIFDKTSYFNLPLVGDAKTSTTQTKFASTSMYFDGTGDYVEIADNSLLDLVRDFTLEFWMYHTSTADTGYATLVGGNGSGSNGWNVYMIESSGNLYFYHSSFLITATSALTVNTWHHVAVSRSGSSLKMFVDGTQVGSTATTSATLEQNSSNLGTRIGYDIGANGYYEGYIENLQLVYDFAKYTSNFTVPTQTQGRTYQATS